MPSRHRSRREHRDARLRELLARFEPLRPQYAPSAGTVPAAAVQLLSQGEQDGAVAAEEDEFWRHVPEGLDPSSGDLDAGRAQRKRQQLGSMVRHVLPLLSAGGGDTIVDFGAGSGHLGLLLAWLRPDCHVVLVERKEYSAQYGRRRISSLGVGNCEFFCGGIEDFADLLAKAAAPEAAISPAQPRLRGAARLDVGVAMHACGQLTDLALSLCVEARARFALCPCWWVRYGPKL
jgi:SAM-dependent methyltransferase